MSNHSSVQDYRITLERDVYFPGEVVRGELYINIIKEIKCRSIRLELKGKGFCGFYIQRGKERDYVTNSMYYARERWTILGNVYKTPTIDAAGSRAVFNPPWSPKEGLLQIPIPKAGARQIALRVMDEDWGKDDLLGETVFDPEEAIAKCSKNEGRVTFPLYRKGKIEGSSSITFSISVSSPENDTEASCFEILIHEANDLRKADWVGKNDVYVQCYVPEDLLDTSKAFPAVDKKTIIEPTEIKRKFEFQLPEDLPSSLETGNFDGGYDGYVRYSIYSCIDIKWGFDPSTRCCFSVVQPVSSHHPSLRNKPPLQQSKERIVRPLFCIPPLCCFFFEIACINNGPISLDVSIKKSVLAPGELLKLKYVASNNSTKKCELRFILRRSVRVFAEGRAAFKCNEFVLKDKIMIESGESKDSVTELPVPSVSPAYPGCTDVALNWLKANPRGGFQLSRQFSGVGEPITWRYELIVQMEPLPFSNDIELEFPLLLTSIGPQVLESTAEEVAVEPIASDTTTTTEKDYYHNWNTYTPLPSLQAADNIDYRPDIGGTSVVTDKQEDACTYSNMSFTPSYVYYDSSSLYNIPKYQDSTTEGGSNNNS